MTGPPRCTVWLADLHAAAAALRATDISGQTPAAVDHSGPLAPADAPLATSPRALAAIAMRLALQSCFGPAICSVPLHRDRYGRPRLPPDVIGDVSLSHTGHHALIAVGPVGPLGVDLEADRAIRMPERRRRIIEAAAQAVTPSRTRGVECEIADERRLIYAWVALEALAKADGRGIGHLLTLIGALGGGPVQPEAAAQIAHQLAVNVRILDIGAGHMAALASPHVEVKVERFPTTRDGIAKMLDNPA